MGQITNSEIDALVEDMKDNSRRRKKNKNTCEGAISYSYALKIINYLRRYKP